MSNKNNLPLGLDVGTSRLVVARQNENDFHGCLSEVQTGYLG